MKEQGITKPRNLTGVLELLPEDQITLNRMIDSIRNSYESYGFLPIDTPIIEYADILLAKAGGETEKQIYQFQKGKNEIALRFDLTVPLAKYTTLNQEKINFPFRRYQIGKVYRGEKTQKCRFREFYQCDVDIIGEELDLANDAEIIAIIYTTFQKLKLGKFTICLNNRKLMNGLLESIGQEEKKIDILRIIDKIEKIGREEVEKELFELEIGKEDIQKILMFVEMSGNTEEKIEKLKQMKIQNDTFLQGLEEIEKVIEEVKRQQIPEEYYRFDLSIARGLDYYTGTVYETFLDSYQKLGSICSGGRYDNLTQYYTTKKLQGVGVSIGLTRLYVQLQEIGILPQENKSMAQVLILPMTEQKEICYQIANQLRQNEIATQVYQESKVDMKGRMKYADRMKIPYVFFIGEDEISSKTIMLKNMKQKEQQRFSMENIVEEFMEYKTKKENEER